MPNHCYQSVFIKGPRDMVRELYFNLDRKRVLSPRFCDVVVPMPLDQAGNSGEWCNKNWGTKWDVAEVKIDELYKFSLEHGSYGELFAESDKEYPIPVAWFSFKCWTAWAPPVPVWDKLHAMGIEVEADYEDEGLMFKGEYMHGVDSSWEPTALDDERWEPEEEKV